MPAYRSVLAGFAQLAEEVGQAGRANREIFEQLVAAEVGRVAARLGVVPAAELSDARERLETAEDELEVLRIELDDLQLRVATLEAASPQSALVDDEPGDLDAPVVDEPDLPGDETGAAGVRP
ncbi:hypothetical protein GCM10022197_39100 [Microlunatus spumicola]|uniref:Accessory factor UbiK family protein n=1 Tax=Microlunatus spumicola TaxID=81499 RepID=A0ABP6YAI0_9ACTN